MSLSQSEVEKIAKLARLGLIGQEKESFAKQLSSILEYIEQLKQVDTKGVEPTAQVTGLENVMREDAVAVQDEQSRAELLGQVSNLENDLVKTKSVF